MKNVEIAKVLSLCDELHLVILETEERNEKSVSMSREQVKDIMKNQVAKPLFILRAE